MKFIRQLIQKLDKIIELLSEEKEEREARKQEERDRLLMEYAREKGKRVPTGGIHTSREMEDRPVRSDGDLIPYNLTEAEKRLLDEFYNH